MNIERHDDRSEQRENGRRPVEVQERSLASAKHENRNEDAALGDIGRLEAELQNPPTLTADPASRKQLLKRHELRKLAAANTEAMQRFSEVERDAADKLKDENVFGVFDGVSGSESGMGAGAVASRIASANFAERMADLPPNATVEQTKQALREAFDSANTDIADHKSRNQEFAEDLKQMATTADVFKAIDNKDGTHEIVYGHMGDSRIYVLDGETGKLRQETRDDSAVEYMVQTGKLSRQEADLVIKADKNDLDALYKAIPGRDPKFLEKMVDYRQAIFKSLNGDKTEPTIGSFKVKEGDRVLVSSDGIHDNIPEARIAEIMREGGDVAMKLAEEAHRRAGGSGQEKAPDAKGPDDITLQVVEFGDAKERQGSALDVRPEDLDAAVNDSKRHLEAVPSARDVGQAEHDRQKYEVLRELTERLTVQLNAEPDPAKSEQAATFADELTGKGPQKQELRGLTIALLHEDARREGRPEPPIMDLQGAAWMEEFKKNGWSTEQVEDWVENRKKEIDAEIRGAMDADPSLKRLVEARQDLKHASVELHKLKKEMAEAQKRKDRSALSAAKDAFVKERDPFVYLTPEQTKQIREQAAREAAEDKKTAARGKDRPKKRSWWQRLTGQ